MLDRAVRFGVMISLLGLVACSHVRPYQREHQARIEKQLDERGSAIDEFESHVWAVREGAAGGDGTAGGGCGCN